jgi:hypothetical protein
MSHPKLQDLLRSIAHQESNLPPFLAPCLKFSKIRTRIQGMIYTVTPQDRDFEGWGIFQPVDTKMATLTETAELWQIDAYFHRSPTLRVRLIHRLKNQTWLAYPVNESDMRQRFGTPKPIALHLVTEGSRFEVVLVRLVGTVFYFEAIDRLSDPIAAEQLQNFFQNHTTIEQLAFPGLTPEMRSAYHLATQQIQDFSNKQDEKRLRSALQTGGGTLDRFQDKGDFWTVEWRTGDGEEHTSAISKGDLTVMNAGICLDDLDEDFDLQSLVGVVEQREY